MSRSGKYSWETELLFVIWMVNLKGTLRTEIWQHEFHAGVKGYVRIESVAYVWKHLWNEMQINGNNMLSLQIWTQMRKCKKKALHGNTHFTCGNYYYQIGYSNVQNLGHPHGLPLLVLVQNFTTIVCNSFAFLVHLDEGNDCAISCQYNHNLPYFNKVLTLSLFSSLPGFMGISKCVDPALWCLLGSGRWRRVLVWFHCCVVWIPDVFPAA